MILFLAQDFFPHVPGDSWKSEVTYEFRSVSHPSESQVYKWREAYEIKASGSLAVSSTLLENLLDGQKLPLPQEVLSDTWTVRDAFKNPTREPAHDETSSYRLWRLVQIPTPGQSFKWEGNQKWPSATATCSRIAEPSKERNAIQFSFKEHGGMQAKGTGICAADGTLRSGKMTVENAFLPGGDFSPHRLEITWKALEK